jgi:hypothetical protein
VLVVHLRWSIFSTGSTKMFIEPLNVVNEENFEFLVQGVVEEEESKKDDEDRNKNEEKKRNKPIKKPVKKGMRKI